MTDISAFTKELEPVKPICKKRCFTIWALNVIVYFLAIYYFIGFRNDMPIQLGSMRFWVEVTSLFFLWAGTTYSVFKMYTPCKCSWKVYLFLVPFLVWAGVFVVHMVNALPLPELSYSVDCLKNIAFIVLLPFVVLAGLVRNSFTNHPKKIAFFVGLSTASLGVLGVFLICSETSMEHCLFSHISSSILVGLCTFFITLLVLKKL